MENFKNILKGIFNILKKIFCQIWLIFDTIKGFLLVCAITFFILFLTSLIVHNILRFEEISIKYTGEYKKLYSVKNKMMNVYITGEGEKTILIMSGYAVSSPTMEYKALADELGKEYRVVIVEYFGTGFSLSTKDKRTNENIVEEVREALETAGISGPYILMPFDISNIYAMYYTDKYPGEVAGIISIDGMYPKAINKSSFKDKYLPNAISNVNFYSVVGFTGLFRWETYLNPERFNINKLEANDSYGENEIKLYRRLLANKFLTKEMRGQLTSLEDNMKDMSEYQYHEGLPVLQILTKDSIEEYSNRNEDMKKYATNMVTNTGIQKISILNGNVQQYLFENPEKIFNTVKYDYKTEASEEDLNINVKPDDNIYIDSNISDGNIDVDDTEEDDVRKTPTITIDVNNIDRRENTNTSNTTIKIE